MISKDDTGTPLMVSAEGDFRIPQTAIKALGLEPGARLTIFRYKGRIEIVPIPTVDEMKGFLPDISTEIEREREDRV